MYIRVIYDSQLLVRLLVIVKVLTWDLAIKDKIKYCISKCRKFKISDISCCKTLFENHTAIEVNCPLTLSIIIFPSGLETQTDFACLSEVIRVVTSAIEVVPATSGCS